MVRVGPLDEAWTRRKVLLDDADTLDRAVAVIRLRSRQPRSVTVRALCIALKAMADRLRTQAGTADRG